MTTNVDMEEEDILRQAAHRFAVPPTRVTLKGAVPLERLQHGDTLILPIKVKFPFLETRNSRIVTFTWLRRPMSKAEYFIPATWTVQRMHQVLKEANHLHPHSLTIYWQGIPLHHEGQTMLESFLPPPAFDLEVTPVETYTLLPTEEQMHQRGGASRGRRTSHRRSEEAQQRTQMQSWALKRIHDHVSIEACVAKSLVRTEQRTVSALLGARSSTQVHHVVKAALQRNGYVELAKKVAGDLEKKKAEDVRDGRDGSSSSRSPERNPSHPSMSATHPGLGTAAK